MAISGFLLDKKYFNFNSIAARQSPRRVSQNAIHEHELLAWLKNS